MSDSYRIKGVTYYEWDSRSLQCGHVSLRLSDGTYVSLWQMSPLWRVLLAIGLSSIKTNMFVLLIDYILSMIVPFMRNTYHTMSYKQDVMIMNREANKRITFHGSFLDEERIKEWWKQISNVVSYGLMTCNCSTIVFRALFAGGATDYVVDPKHLIWTPTRLYMFCEMLQWNTYNVLNGRMEHVETDFEYIFNGLKKDARDERKRKQEKDRKKEELRKRQATQKEETKKKKESECIDDEDTTEEEETNTDAVQDQRYEDIDTDYAGLEVVPAIVDNPKSIEHDGNGKKKPSKRNRKRR